MEGPGGLDQGSPGKSLFCYGFIFIYVSVSICHTWVGALGGQKRASDPPADEVTSYHESPDDEW